MNSAAMCLYTYLAVVTSVYDGDTVTLNVDLGMYTWRHGITIRLNGIDAYEVKGKEREKGLKCRDRLRKRIDGKEIVLRTYKDKKGKYGRYLGELFDDVGNINDWMVEIGCAIHKQY